MSSSRLPGKVLLPMGRDTVLSLLISRVKRSRLIDKMIVATSVDNEDDRIEKACQTLGISCFRGSLENVLQRYYDAATMHASKGMRLFVVRITGDCPLIDPELIDEVIDGFLNHLVDYYSNTIDPTYPDGMDIEVFTYEALKNAYEKAVRNSDREHVTLFIKNNETFSKANHVCTKDYSDLRLTLDEPDDYKLLTALHHALSTVDCFYSLQDIVRLLQRHPHLSAINGHIMRDEGLRKSLMNDRLHR